jgi:D,D-heptose 1,7-bisphosphate phosphatase
LAGIRGKNKAVFIDRDGTVIRERNYLRKIKDIKLLAGVVEGMKALREHGFKLVMVSNQSGIGRGYFTESKLKQIHSALQRILKKKGAGFDGMYYCKHTPGDACSCRKPKTGMVEKAAKELRIAPKRSFSIGDHTNDFLLGQNMGGRGVFLLTGHGREEYAKKIKRDPGRLRPDKIAKNFREGANWIIRQNEN